MKQWMKENKWTLIISSAVILLPILIGLLLWDQLPDSLNTHWGADGNPDSSGGKAFAILVPPLIMLAVHWLCILASAWDMKKQQSKKPVRVVLWSLPVLSLICMGIVYTAALEMPFMSIQLLPLLMGLFMVILGNMLPKLARNRTLGIKLKWTLHNDENWDKTHRLGGKVWFVCGLVMLLTVFLPAKLILWIFGLVLAVMILVPMGYSYWLYRQHRKAGIVYDCKPRSKGGKWIVRVNMVFSTLILLGCAVLMFTGDIQYHCEASALRIDPTYWQDLTVEYDAIDRVEFREDWEPGYRSNGFASARLSLGNYQNDEVGYYTLYAYAGSDAWVVLEVEGKILVLSGKDTADTRALYEALLEKVY